MEVGRGPGRMVLGSTGLERTQEAAAVTVSILCACPIPFPVSCAWLSFVMQLQVNEPRDDGRDQHGGKVDGAGCHWGPHPGLLAISL